MDKIVPMIRGQSLDTGEWVHGYYFLKSGELPCIQEVNTLKDFLVKARTLGVCLQSKDGNDTNIYSGDIAVLIDEDGVADMTATTVGVVTWNAEEAYYEILSSSHCFDFSDYPASAWAVMGNEWDTPDFAERIRRKQGR